eukprot:6198568-Pleurochrysis_carterae.AAC.1
MSAMAIKHTSATAALSDSSCSLSYPHRSVFPHDHVPKPNGDTKVFGATCSGGDCDGNHGSSMLQPTLSLHQRRFAKVVGCGDDGGGLLEGSHARFWHVRRASRRRGVTSARQLRLYNVTNLELKKAQTRPALQIAYDKRNTSQLGAELWGIKFGKMC